MILPRLLNLWLGLWSVLFFLGAAKAQAQQDTLFIESSLTTLKPQNHQITFFEDISSSLLFDSLLALVKTEPLIFESKNTTNFGYSSSAFWAKVILKNSTEQPQNLYVVSKDQYSTDLDFYELSNDRRYEKHFGLYQPLRNRGGFMREFVYETQLNPKETKVFFIRTISTRQTIIDIQFYSPKEYDRRSKIEFYLFGLYFGTAIALILYNFFLYISLRDRNFIIYVLFNLLYVSAVWLHNGFGYETLPEEIAFFSRRYLMYFFYFLSLIFAITFIRDFLNLKKNIPKFYNATYFFIVLFILLSLSSFFLPQTVLSKAINLSTLPTAIFAIIIGLVRIKQGDKTAIYFFVGWSVFIIGGILFQLEGLNIIPSNFLTSYGYQIGSGLEMVLLSLALGDRINTLRIEKEDAEKEAMQAELFRLRNIELAKALDESERLKRIAEEANKQKTELFAIAAHDLKNPLTSISGFSSLILEESNLEKINLMAQRILNSSSRMVSLISDLLESSAYEIGSITLKREYLNVKKILDEVLIQNSALAELKLQSIEVTCDPSLTIFADSIRLFETIDNLVSNAIKYSYRQTSIQIIVEPVDLRNRYPNHPTVYTTKGVLISVKDEGQGLTDSDKEKIFQRFQKLSSKPTGNESSSGLGLSIVKDILMLHGGAVWVESAGKGKGSTFYLFFPTQ